MNRYNFEALNSLGCFACEWLGMDGVRLDAHFWVLILKQWMALLSKLENRKQVLAINM